MAAQTVDHETMVLSQETALAPPGLDFEKLSLADQAVMFAIYNEVKKALEKRVKGMNGTLRGTLEADKMEAFENENVRAILAGGTKKDDVVSYDKDALERRVGLATLIEMKVFKVHTTTSLDEDALLEQVKAGAISGEVLEEVRRVTPGGTTARTLRVTPQGELKKRLRAFTAKALPAKKKG